MINLNKPIEHRTNGEFCSCDSDCVTCQICARRVCGMLTQWMTPVPGKNFNGNVCHECSPVTGENASNTAVRTID